MLRLVGFFIAVFFLMGILRGLPIVGGIFRIPLFGFWITAILLSMGLSRFAVWALDRRKLQTALSSLGVVETPHNQAKLGALLVQHRRYREGLRHLDQALEAGEERADLHFRRGLALVGLKRRGDAHDAFSRAVELDEEVAYGSGLLRLAENVLEASPEQSLETLERFERSYGPVPESAYRKGLALTRLSRRQEARAAFREVDSLVQASTTFQKRSTREWALKAWLRSIF